MTIITFEKLTTSQDETFLLLKFPYDGDIIDAIKSNFSHAQTGYGYHKEGDVESPLYNEYDEDCWFTDYNEASFEAIEKHLETPVPNEYWEEVKSKQDDEDEKQDTESDDVDTDTTSNKDKEVSKLPDEVRISISNDKGVLKLDPFNESINEVILNNMSEEEKQVSNISTKTNIGKTFEKREYPVGLLSHIETVLHGEDVSTTVIDNRVTDGTIGATWEFDGELCQHQLDTVNDVIEQKNTEVIAPTGVDKLTIASRLIYELNASTTILTTTEQRVNDWKESISECLGTISKGYVNTKGMNDISVCTYSDALDSGKESENALIDVDIVIFDESQQKNVGELIWNAGLLTNATYRIAFTPIKIPDSHPKSSYVTASIGKQKTGYSINELQQNGLIPDVEFISETGEYGNRINGDKAVVVTNSEDKTNDEVLNDRNVVVRHVSEMEPTQVFDEVILDISGNISLQHAQCVLRMINPDTSNGIIRDVNRKNKEDRTTQHEKMFMSLLGKTNKEKEKDAEQVPETKITANSD